MDKFQFLDHQADIKIRAFGNSLTELFSNAAQGMMTFLYGDLSFVTVTKYEKIAIEADDIEALLVDWLAELLYLTNRDHSAYIQYHIIEISEHKIVAEIGGGHATAKDDIKAVTYHDLQVLYDKDRKSWRADVVYDI